MKYRIEIKSKEKKECNHSFDILKRQLFKNKTIHLAKTCSACGAKDKEHKWIEKTKENLLKSIGWINPSEETALLDELMGFGIKDFVQEKVSEIKPAKMPFVCGLCKDSCLIGCLCPHHWP